VAELRWLSVAEIATHLGVNPETVYDWIASRGMPAHRLGRLWRFQTDEVDEWVRSGKSGSARRSSKPSRKASR
jgi:excisionase family DNA binding protein